MAENEKVEEKAKDALVVKMGEEEKTLTSADVQELLAKHSGLQKKVEGLANFEKILDRYGVDTDTYLKHSEGAIAIASKLIEEGVIDAQGRLIQSKEPPKENKDNLTFARRESAPDEKVDEIAARALGPLQDRLKKIEETQSRLVEWDMRNRLAKKFPDLEESDMDNIFDTAFRDRTKSLTQHAEMYAQSKGQRMAELRRKHAQEFGINLEEFDKKRAEERTKKETGKDDLAMLIGERKIAFETGGDKSKVSPRQATIEFFKKTLGGS